MLRREIHLPDQPLQWLLIPQIEHARLSGALAAHFLPLQDEPLRDALQWAIAHHDDGWAEWDATPGLDEQGRPRSFKEMHLVDSLRIWTASIDLAEQHAAIAAYFVADHFLKLLPDASDGDSNSAAESWRTTIEKRKSRWGNKQDENQWRGACDWLPAFDALSLWMCGAILVNEQQFTLLPGHVAETTFTRVDDGAEERRFSAEPWRFDAARVELPADASAAPVAEYRSAKGLLEASVPRRVRWEVATGEM